MPAKHSRHVALTGSLAEWAEGQVAKGEYTSVSDLIRTAIRLLKARDEADTGGRVPSSIRPPQSQGQS